VARSRIVITPSVVSSRAVPVQRIIDFSPESLAEIVGKDWLHPMQAGSASCSHTYSTSAAERRVMLALSLS